MAFAKRKERVKIEDKISWDAIAIKTVKPTLKDNVGFEVGQHLKIGKVVNTPDGLYYRLANSTRWLSADFIAASSYPVELIRDFTNPEIKQPSYKEKKRFIKNKSKTLKVFDKNKHTNKKGKQGVFGMDKIKLRNALAGLQPDEKIKITFIGDMTSQSGEYTVLRTKKGKGKGGSQLAELQHCTTGDLLITGTPHSDYVLNVITGDGTLHGHLNIDEVPPTFETDKTKAKSLKEIFVGEEAGSDLRARSQMQPKQSERDTRSRFKPESAIQFTINSTFAPLNGTFRLEQFELMRGRYGKVVANLVNLATGEAVVFDTFKHSTVVESLTVSP